MNVYRFSFIGKTGGGGGASEEEIKKAVDNHNIDGTSHPDIRTEIETLQDAVTQKFENQQTQIDEKIPISQKAVANGVATLDASGQVPLDQINLNTFKYKGAWDAATNFPVISHKTGAKDDFYIVSADGTQNLGDSVDGKIIGTPILYELGSNLVHNGNVWEQIRSKQKVSSVNGQIGNVVVDKAGVGLDQLDNEKQVTLNTEQEIEGKKIFNKPLIIRAAPGMPPFVINTATFVQNLHSHYATRLYYQRSIKIGKTAKVFDGSADITFTPEEIGIGPTGAGFYILENGTSEASVPSGNLIFRKS